MFDKKTFSSKTIWKVEIMKRLTNAEGLKEEK